MDFGCNYSVSVFLSWCMVCNQINLRNIPCWMKCWDTFVCIWAGIPFEMQTNERCLLMKTTCVTKRVYVYGCVVSYRAVCVCHSITNFSICSKYLFFHSYTQNEPRTIRMNAYNRKSLLYTQLRTIILIIFDSHLQRGAWYAIRWRRRPFYFALIIWRNRRLISVVCILWKKLGFHSQQDAKITDGGKCHKWSGGSQFTLFLCYS